MLQSRVSPLMADMNSDENYSDASIGNGSTSNGTDWEKQMLQALQDTAPPEPIRLACMKPVPNRPGHFGEEFHGKISREQVVELLTGAGGTVNGRFLVRESLSAPGDYSLSLTFGGEVEHYRLFYIDGMYSTSKTDEKRFPNIVDLVVDILELQRRLVHAEKPPSIDNKDIRKKSNPKVSVHDFKTHDYKQPKWCDICGKFMWGLKGQGLKCATCGMNIHQKCHKDDSRPCVPPPPKDKNKPRKKSSVGSPRDSTISVETFRTQCYYQESCVHFLQHLELPVSLFDVTALSPCYCDHCCQEVETPLYKSGDPAREYSIPMGWCRFQLAASDKPPVNTCSWNMAFMSLKPSDVIDVLQTKFQSEPENSGPEMGNSLTKLTPSIICADLDSEKLRYTDPENDSKRAGQIVLQVYIQPFSYRLMGRVGSVEEIDPFFKKDSIYWVTSQMCYVVPFALLVKIMDATYLQI
ncbi:uncharacterized protein LOC116619735 [Nematostella vectensis]|uniref:uncharacterized protein LOC116619735 n=1 Tax=Nematostella vectensis TaxID=45351 RepID=UPI002077564B|nr:uncharacterized protein LOC116619735 [Nematostella vectensis]